MDQDQERVNREERVKKLLAELGADNLPIGIGGIGVVGRARRAFIVAAGLVAAGLVAVGLSGCADDPCQDSVHYVDVWSSAAHCPTKSTATWAPNGSGIVVTCTCNAAPKNSGSTPNPGKP